jgi:hypothetical protein
MMLIRRSLAIVLAASLLLPAFALPATAAPGQPVPTVQVGLIVDLVAPALLKVHISYTCQPAPGPFGFVSITVTQSVPAEAAGVGDASLTCDGAGHELDVFVFGGPVFSRGDALASAQACTVLVCGTDSRKVVIAD